MLLRIVVQNFLSFYERTEFDMFPNPKREIFPNHIIEANKIPLLKQGLIYGPNGSGKSNFIKIISFLKTFVIKKDFLKKIDLNDVRFQLAPQNAKNIILEIEFCKNEHCYIYHLEIDANNVIAETLSISGLGSSDNTLLFSRHGNQLESDYRLSNDDVVSDFLNKNQHSSFFALNTEFPLVKNPDIENAFSWFQYDLEIFDIHTDLPELIRMMSVQNEMLAFANTIFKNTNIAAELDIKETPFNNWIQNKNEPEIQNFLESKQISENLGISIYHNGRINYSLTMKKGERIVQEFMFKQGGYEGYSKQMDINTQSDGTVRLLLLIPALYDAIFTEKVIFIDEIENSMHPDIIYELIKYFSNTPSKGQLIFTTHLTNLLNQQNVARPDEVWIVEKHNGNSTMRSLNDFKIHNTINLENGYREGRYGGLPQISDFETELPSSRMNN